MKNINRTAAAAAVVGSIAVAAIGLGAGTASADTDSGPRCFWSKPPNMTTRSKSR